MTPRVERRAWDLQIVGLFNDPLDLVTAVIVTVTVVAHPAATITVKQHHGRVSIEHHCLPPWRSRLESECAIRVVGPVQLDHRLLVNALNNMQRLVGCTGCRAMVYLSMLPSRVFQLSRPKGATAESLRTPRIRGWSSSSPVRHVFRGVSASAPAKHRLRHLTRHKA